ncbi:Hypothetical Protein FCC1311_040052 [Hondaea fermentalgiana]|uniref:Uncharacterized protein n=1 Tax=Hondaea fermentalgiana TaxID=2315210 RepID=A0A2R5G9P6_9STRA|nr:Hypothetical Protein FCC1311_040052 [Hondaea fermentalgiana]|eukprot:GBG27782.1 Hypothetical Protein FCC1311_040052 [Hondaea fermentalgiana]
MSGVQFPADAEGRRSTTAPAKKIWERAFAGVDDDGVEALVAEKNWRKAYAGHVYELTRKSARTPELTLKVAQQGLEAVQDTFEFVRDGKSYSIPEALDTFTNVPKTAVVKSEAKRPVVEAAALSVPFSKGEIASGDALEKRVEELVANDHVEPDVLEAIKEINASGEDCFSALADTYFVILGATSELCPLEPLLEMGLNVVAVSRPSPARQAKLVALAQNAPEGASLSFPVMGAVNDPADLTDPSKAADIVGVDIVENMPEVANWLVSLYPGKRLVIGSYIYLDGANHVRASVAMDAVLQRVLEKRPDTALAYLGSPAVAYPIPQASWEVSMSNFKKGPTFWQNALGLFLRSYAPNNEDPVVAESVNTDAADTSKEIYMFNGIVNMQGPNYLLAKTLQNWRAMVAREVNKALVSVNMAPSSRTDSVMHVPAVARGVRGFEAFPPLTSFDPATARSMMALLLVHDLVDKKSPANPEVALRNPLDIFASYGVHAGLWRAPFSQESLGPSLYAASFFV